MLETLGARRRSPVSAGVVVRLVFRFPNDLNLIDPGRNRERPERSFEITNPRAERRGQATAAYSATPRPHIDI